MYLDMFSVIMLLIVVLIQFINHRYSKFFSQFFFSLHSRTDPSAAEPYLVHRPSFEELYIVADTACTFLRIVVIQRVAVKPVRCERNDIRVFYHYIPCNPFYFFKISLDVTTNRVSDVYYGHIKKVFRLNGYLRSSRDPAPFQFL